MKKWQLEPTSVAECSLIVDQEGCPVVTLCRPEGQAVKEAERIALLVSLIPEMIHTLRTGGRFRNCAIVDDDFPGLRDEFDSLLFGLLNKIDRETPS